MKRFFFTPLLYITILISVVGCSRQQDMTWQEQYDLGVRYLSEGNYEDAIIAFNAAIEIEPNSIETYLELAKAYEANGNIHSAELTLKTAKILSTDENIRLEIENKLNEIADFAEGTDGVDETDPNDEATSAQMDYLALAKEKIASDDLDGAIAILEDGYEQRNDRIILEMLCSARLGKEIETLTDEYGIAPIETVSKKADAYSEYPDYGWSRREGIVSAKKTFLDDDSILDLVVIRAEYEDYERFGYTYFYVEVYRADAENVYLSGSIKCIDMNDLEYLLGNIYIKKVNGNNCIVIENFGSGYWVDYFSRRYTVLQYKNDTLTLKMRIDQSAGGSSDIAESMYLYDEYGVETEIVLKAEDFAIEEKGTVGKYAYSDNIYRDALIEYGFEQPIEYYTHEYGLLMPTYFNSNDTIKLSRLFSTVDDNDIAYSGVEDFTGLRE